MTLGRFYDRSRRAWSPRLWPQFLVALAVTEGVVLLAHPSTLASLAVGVVVGFVVGFGRSEIWRRRHPIITPDQFITDLRRAAPWN